MADQFAFEGLLLAGNERDSFPDFYRAHVRPEAGCRVTAADLRSAYVAWAETTGAIVASARATRTFMEANGHHASKSSSMFYKDTALGDFANAPMPTRVLPIVDARPVREAITVTVDDIDQIIAELSGIRRRLARIMPAAPARRRSA